MLPFSNSIKKLSEEIAADTKIDQSRACFFKISRIMKLKNKKIASIKSCPISSPMLKANNGINRLSFATSVSFKKFEKPRPWINPKDKIIK